MSDTATQLRICNRMFRPHEHEYNEAGMVFVGIAPTIRRLNELGEWSFYIVESTVAPTQKTTKSGKSIHLATVVGDLHIPGLGNRAGSGSAESFDVDTAIKSAQAYALRKAANLFGVALYLWDDVGRAYAEDAENVATLKRLVLLDAQRRGFRGTGADALADFLGAEPELLQDKAGLEFLLEREGVI